jgi:hypothetical protein
MTPLGDRSVNRQSRIPVVGFELRNRINDENVPPASNASRLLVPTKSSIARPISPSPSLMSLPTITRAASATPGRGRLSTFTSDDSLNASFARRQSLARPSTVSTMHYKKTGTPKPPIKSIRRPTCLSEPSSEVAKVGDIKNRPSGGGNVVLPIKLPLKAPSTPQKDSHERPVTRHGSMPLNIAAGTKSTSPSKLLRSSVPNSPAVVSPVLDSPSTDLSSLYLVSPISPFYAPNETVSATLFDNSNTRRPPRLSSLQSTELQGHDVGLGIGVSTAGSSFTETQERKYLPVVHSFSRPRAQKAERSSASLVSLAVPQHLVRTDSEKLATSTTPSIVCRSPSLTSKTAVADDVLTFAGRRLGNSTDLAALDHGSARSSKRKHCSTKISPLSNVNLTLQGFPPRVPSPSEQNKLSPIRLLFGDKGAASDDVFEYTRVKQLSGSLLSSSFAGSTLSISEDADHLILGGEGACIPSSISQTSLAVPADAEFDLPSPSENGFRVSWPADFGFSSADGPDSPTVQSSPSVRPKAFSGVSEESEQSITEQNVLSLDQNYDAQFETRSLNHGTSTNNQLIGGDVTTTLHILEGAPARVNALSSAGTSSVKPLHSTARLPKIASKAGTQNIVYTRNDRLPSYMLPTPASEARRTPNIALPEIRRSNMSTPNLNARRETPTTKPTTTNNTEQVRVPPPSRRTPITELCGAIRSGRSTPTSNISRTATPIARPSTGSQLTDQPVATPKSTSKTEASHRVSIGHIKIVRQSLHPVETSRDGTFPPARPRSDSKGKTVLNNLKGMFSGKRDTPSTPGSSGRRFSIGSRKSGSTEADIPDVPTVPAVPAIPAMPVIPSVPAVPVSSVFSDSRRKSTARSILVNRNANQEAPLSDPKLSISEPSTLPQPTRKSTGRDSAAKKDVAEEDRHSLRRKASRHKVAAIEATSELDSEKKTRDTVALMEMGLTLRQEASKEDDLVRKERMASFAQVMLDTVTNAVEAERNMYTAMQAAEQAKMSYMMTQQSVQEMNKLVSTSRRLPLFKRKKRSDGNV